MIKKTLILITLAILAATAGQARTVRDFFIGEKGDLFAMLSKTARMDLLDYYDNGQVVAARNNLQGSSQLTAVDGNYLSIAMSNSKSVQMLLTTQGKDSVIVVIETFNTPVKDSSISFYDTRWNKVKNPGKLFKMPALDDFVLPSVDKKERQRLVAEQPFALISLSLEGDGHTTLVARHGLKQYLVASEFEPYRKTLAPALMYTLDGTKWKPIKPSK